MWFPANISLHVAVARKGIAENWDCRVSAVSPSAQAVYWIFSSFSSVSIYRTSTYSVPEQPSSPPGLQRWNVTESELLCAANSVVQ